MKKNWRVWLLVDKDGNIIAKGRKKDVMKECYIRYVYCLIHSDSLYQTNELLFK